MKLLIVESPAKAKTIEKYLGKGFKVISSYGHVRGIPSTKGAVDPENSFSTHYEINEKSIKHVTQMAKEFKNSDVIYLATDPDREGEAISWHVLEAMKLKRALKKDTDVKRVVFNEITKNAVLSAINNPRDVDMNLVHAQQARQALDYLVGFTLSPILWRKLPGSKSAGRVQSVALRVICERESEIEKFKQQEYWTLDAEFANIEKNIIKAQLYKMNGEKLDKFAIANQNKAEEIKGLLPKEGYQVSDIKAKQMKRVPSAPFTTSSMLQEASRKLGFSAKKTASIAQKLYEGIPIGNETLGLITYMRTDSVAVSKEAVKEAVGFIKQCYGDKYLPSKSRVYKSKTKNAQEAHEAIRPTSVTRKPEDMSQYLDADQLKLYGLIWKRMVSSQMSDALIESTTVEITTKEQKFIFKANGSTVVFDGFYKVYKEGVDDESKSDSQKLPKLSKDEDLNLMDINGNQHFTQPPPRYTEASLVKKMEELGIGRPSTYPVILNILVDRKYSRLEKKRFIPEVRGRLVNAFLTGFFDKYVEYDFTAKLEDDLDCIANGKEDWKRVLSGFWSPFKSRADEILDLKTKEILSSIEESLKDFIFPANDNDDGKNNQNIHKCPECKEGILGLRNSKFGSFIGCSNYPDCNYKRSFGSSDVNQDYKENNFEQKSVCIDKKSGDEVFLKKGPYGFYLQVGEGKSMKRVSIPKGVNVDDVDGDFAAKLINLPHLVGQHPETGLDIVLKIGRYGPYLEYDKGFYSVKNQDFLNITLNEAVELIKSYKNKKKVKKTGNKK